MICNSVRFWVGHATDIQEMTNIYKVLVRKLEGKKHFEDLDVK